MAKWKKIGRQKGPERASIEHAVDYTADELAFMHAVDVYKRHHGRPFPTLCEVLAILRALGYQIVVEKPIETDPDEVTK